MNDAGGYGRFEGRVLHDGADYWLGKLQLLPTKNFYEK